MTKIDAFFEALWQDYVALTPRVAEIRALFTGDNPRVANDHVAFRTFDHDPIRIEQLEPALLELGYERHADYHFEEKRLDAWSYRPPLRDQPRIFLSALRVDALSRENQRRIETYCAAVDPTQTRSLDVFHAGRLWPMPSRDDYHALLAESEYAAWLAVFGLRPNHFTISVNSLDRPEGLQAVVERVEAAGFPINEAGGRLRGSPEQGLEQAATLADEVRVQFASGQEETIPSCYYEFALRHPLPDGSLYEGFVAQSADRLFESTHTRNGPGG